MTEDCCGRNSRRGIIRSRHISDGRIQNMIFSNEKYGMKWFREDFGYAEVSCPDGLRAEVCSKREGNLLGTEITICNTRQTPFFTWRTAIGIQFPLEDRYGSSRTCMTERCHSHIFCGGEISYVCALRMGGETPHLGMVLTEGSLCGYSVKRDPGRSSNDRGCFVLHPSPAELLPGECMRIAWVVFPHGGWEDFFSQACKYRPFIRAEASDYVLFPGESCRIRLRLSFPAEKVTVDGEPVAPVAGMGRASDTGSQDSGLTEDGKFAVPMAGMGRASDAEDPEGGEAPGQEETEYEFCWKYEAGDEAAQKRQCLPAALQPDADPREKVFLIEADGIHTWCRILLQEKPHDLASARCRFIARRQQYRGANLSLRGAYLPYDNEEEHIFYSEVNDYNAGRERAGMGLLIARYLQSFPDPGLEQSLSDYTEFVKRELVDTESGLVTNNCRRDDRFQRLYNYPWYMELFTELYHLRRDPEDLETACRIAELYYRKGGLEHYPVELPVLSLCSALKEAGAGSRYEEMSALFREHADRIAVTGHDYPPFEVDYEQCIVAPAAWILLQVYALTGEQKYLDAGRKQLEVLELFNGMQPDFHLYETAIRHWDGYWFGKRRMFGDTFPHYWSALTGNCFALYAELSGDSRYRKKARASLRGVLPLFFADGRASCAFLFPETVNGVRGHFYDCCANDQDWGLYFCLREQV